jgi:hypothetical protein
MQFALAMIACPRRDFPLTKAIRSLRYGGFSEVLHVFAEPDTPKVSAPNVVWHANPKRLGGFTNYHQALTWLLAQPNEHLLLAEDDVDYCRGARGRLTRGLNEHPDYTLFNLYTPRRDGPHLRGSGWQRHNRGSKTNGTLAICYRRDGGIRDYATHPGIVSRLGTKVSYDNVMYKFFLDRGFTGCYSHLPSLVDHVGPKSNLGHRDGPHRRGLAFNRNYR